MQSIEVGGSPELLRIAEDVRRGGAPRVLRHHGEDLAVIVPLPRAGKLRGRKPSAADYEAFRSAAGSWADVDTDKLIEDIYATRARSNRPPPEL
jgi:hypothetical protein